MKRSTRLAKRPIYHCPTLRPPKQRLPLLERSQVAVIGSARGLEQEHWPWFFKMMDRVTFGLVDPVIISFGHSQRRVDAFAQRWASLNWLVMLLEYHDESKHRTLTQAAEERDQRIVDTADFMIVFRAGKDEWVDKMTDKAKKAKVKVKIIEL